MTKALRSSRTLTVLALAFAFAGCAFESDGDESGRSQDALSWHSEEAVGNEAEYEKVLAALERQAEKGSFTSDIPKEHGDGRKPSIAYAIVRARTPEERGGIVLVNGRTESYSHYAELVWDMTLRGYTVYMMDHRGQGHSDRLLGYDHVGDSQYQKGHVDRFQDYVDDLHQFITTVVKPDRTGKTGKLFGLGHSMGGTVVTLYAMFHPDVLSRVALTSPMFKLDVDDGFWFDLAVWWHPTDYAKGKGPRDADDARFQGNPLTSSHARFDAKQAVWERHPGVLVGGPTYKWVDCALNAAKRTREGANRIQVPVLLLRAENDRVVEPEGQKQVCDKINTSPKGGTCRLEVLKDSRHEPLIEVDAIRGKALRTIVQFFQQ
jgi:lysophospholipase